MSHTVHKPGLARCSPKRLERDKRVAAALDRWMQTSHASNAEIAEAMAIGERIVRALRTREKPLHTEQRMVPTTPQLRAHAGRGVPRGGRHRTTARARRGGGGVVRVRRADAG